MIKLPKYELDKELVIKISWLPSNIPVIITKRVGYINYDTGDIKIYYDIKMPEKFESDLSFTDISEESLDDLIRAAVRHEFGS